MPEDRPGLGLGFKAAAAAVRGECDRMGATLEKVCAGVLMPARMGPSVHLVYSARTQNAAGSESDPPIAPHGNLRAACGPRQEEKGPEIPPNTILAG